MAAETIIHSELQALLHLLLTTVLAIIYAKKRAVVTLPALMLTSLIGVMLGLEVHPFIIGISSFAAALIVFIAGLELDPSFIRSEKERILVVFSFEAILMLTVFYVLNNLFSTVVAVTIVAIMVASNEAFVVELKKYKGGKLSQFGITLSVLEDALAVFLLSIGFFTTPQILQAGPIFATLITTSIVLIPVLFLISYPFDHLIDTLERQDTRVLLTVLYLSILIALADLLGIPEAIPVFIGAVSLSFREFNKETFNAIESYYVLALMGFVSSLPYAVHKATEIPLTMELFVQAMGIGLILAFVAYFLRFIIVFFASIMGGINVDDALSISLALANTGEFGLIVLSSLVASTDIIPGYLAYSALFAYAFNLTFVSIVVNKLDVFKLKIRVLIQGRVLRGLEMISKEANTVIITAAKDKELKESILELAITVSIVYIVVAAYGLFKHPVIDYIFALFLIGTFLVAIQEVFQRLSDALGRIGSSKTLFAFIFRLLVLYTVVAPLLHFIHDFYASGRVATMIYPLDNPLSLLFILLLTLGIKRVAEKIAKIVSGTVPLE